jgi:hypothetical protein
MLIQYILAALLLLALYGTWKRERQQALTRVAAAAWSALWIGAIVVVLRPEVTDIAATLFGVGRGADVVVYFSVVILFYLVFRIFVRLAKIERDITAVVRAHGIAKALQEKRGGE